MITRLGYLLKHPIMAISGCNSTLGTQTNCQTYLPRVTADPAHLQSILQLVFGVVALVAVIYLIISAIRYQVSLGDPQATAKLRNTIIFTLVGLAIALSAELIVTLALGKL